VQQAFVGQHLIECLKLDGYNIKAISRNLILGVDTVICDFLKDDIPDNALKGIDIVFHLAGYAHDLKSESGIEQTYQKINVDITSKLLLLSVKNNVKKFIFVSSVKAGGVSRQGKCATEKSLSEPDGGVWKNQTRGRVKDIRNRS
jgi:Nucleoside-diphosphate-sugar epimerases